MQAFLSAYQAERQQTDTPSQMNVFPRRNWESGTGNFRFSCDTLFICIVPDMTSTFSPLLPSP